MTQKRSDEQAAPDDPQQAPPAAEAKPDEQAEAIEVIELTELVELVEFTEPLDQPPQPNEAQPEQPLLIGQLHQPPPAAEQPEPDAFETLFEDPQTRAELKALRAANHELVRINERLADAVEQRTADMLATRDAQTRFIADVNRLVRGPLDAIIGYSELLTEDLTSLELHDLAHDVEKIRSAGESLLELLGQMVERRRLDGG
jgi:signal transduction histidine kinase